MDQLNRAIGRLLEDNRLDWQNLQGEHLTGDQQQAVRRTIATRNDELQFEATKWEIIEQARVRMTRS